jgi:cysteine synthase A
MTKGFRVDDHIGNTPMVRLLRVVDPHMAEVWIKLEGMNPAGSIKDRPAKSMIDDAEKRGLLKPGATIVEPTSGNTGIGLAQIAAARGYRLVLCLPAQMSEERKITLTSYGAELVLTDPERRMLAAIERAEELREELGAYYPNQFANPANPLVHYETTAPEIWRDMEGRVDAFVYGSGTGGTITGVGRYLKERDRNIHVVAVEPGRSAVLSGKERGQHEFQGMGPGFIPANLDLTVVDEVLPQWEEEAFPLARRLVREEGLFLGMSSGAIVLAALQVAERMGPGHRVVAISPDSGARYLGDMDPYAALALLGRRSGRADYSSRSSRAGRRPRRAGRQAPPALKADLRRPRRPPLQGPGGDRLQ